MDKPDGDTSVAPPSWDGPTTSRIDAQYEPVAGIEAWAGIALSEEAWGAALVQLQAAEQAASSEALRRAVEVAMRAAAIDTGALEGLYEVDRGFTFSVALQSTAWQAAMAEKGEYVRELFEAQLRAYELSLDVATRTMPITEAWIRTLHEELCAPQQTVRVLTPQGWQEQPLLKGAYKQQPNHVIQPDGTFFAFAPVADTPIEMARFVETLGSPLFATVHPVVQAAYAHYALVRIHPFQDGNGRVARALSSAFLYRAAKVPLVVFHEDKDEYLAALRAADAGRLTTFVSFLMDRTIAAMELVTDEVSSSPEGRAAELSAMLLSGEGLSYTEVDAVGYELLEIVNAEVQQQLNGIALPKGVTLEQAGVGGWFSGPADEGFRHLASRGLHSVKLGGQVAPPASAGWDEYVMVLVRIEPRDPVEFRVRAYRAPQAPLELRLRDVHPQIRTYARLRITAFVRRVIDSFLASLTEISRESLRKAGYLS